MSIQNPPSLPSPSKNFLLSRQRGCKQTDLQRNFLEIFRPYPSNSFCSADKGVQKRLICKKIRILRTYPLEIVFALPTRGGPKRTDLQKNSENPSSLPTRKFFCSAEKGCPKKTEN